MSTENDKTIEVYEKFGQNYLDRNKKDAETDPHYKEDIERRRLYMKNITKDLPKDAKLFEVGSASGNEIKTLQSLGFTNITPSDVADFFIRHLQSEGFSPIKFNLITDEFPDSYDFIRCSAVLVHFKKDEAKAAIEKMFAALNPNGICSFSVKHKEGCTEEWKYDKDIGAERYFSYWDKDELEDFVKTCGFVDIDVEQQGGARACWLACTAKKPA